MMFRWVVLGVLFVSSRMNAETVWTAQRAYAQGDLQKASDILDRLHERWPTDTTINYNRGLVGYKQGAYEQARTSFEAAAKTAVTPVEQEKIYFNWGNSAYKHSLSLLGERWEQNSALTPQVIDGALEAVETAIAQYDNVLVLNQSHQAAQDNKKLAEQLRDKLKQKKEQQQQDQQQDQKDQNKNQQDQKQDQSSDRQKQQKGEEQNKSPSNKNENKQQNQDKGPQKEQQKNGHDTEQHKDQSSNKQQNAAKKPKDQKDDDNQQSEQSKKQDKQSGDEKKSSSSEAAAGEEQQRAQDNQRALGALAAVLDKQQEHEGELQKQVIKQYVGGAGKPAQPGQPRW